MSFQKKKSSFVAYNAEDQKETDLKVEDPVEEVKVEENGGDAENEEGDDDLNVQLEINDGEDDEVHIQNLNNIIG